MDHSSATCSVDGCGRKIRNVARQLCNIHYLRLIRHGDVSYTRPTAQRDLRCTVVGCELKRRARGICSKHLYRLETHGSVDVAKFHVEKHGMCTHPLYTTWLHMRSRCHSPENSSYARYGARGIQVCDGWRYSFSAFVADVGERPPGHTLDRIDNDGDYAPGNVRWAVQATQVKNQNARRDNTSGHKGVSWDGRRAKWRAYKGGGETRVELGSFKSLPDAIAARHRATKDDQFVVCCKGLDAYRLNSVA